MLRKRQKGEEIEELKWDLLGRSSKKNNKPESDDPDCSDNSDESVATIPASS